VDIRRRLIGRSSRLLDDKDRIEVSHGSIIRRLLLFDTYILQSWNLSEFAALVRVFGLEGVVLLLRSRALQVYCDCLTIGQAGQTSTIRQQEGKPVLPLGSYCLVPVGTPDHKAYVSDRLHRNVDSIVGVTFKGKKKLKAAIGEALVPSNRRTANYMIDGLKADLAGNRPSIKAAVALEARKRLGVMITPSDFDLRLHQVAPGDFRSESNLAFQLRLDEAQVHEVVGYALLAVGGVNQRIAEMQTYNALSGFLEDDLPVFEAKLAFLAAALDPASLERGFSRVVSLEHLPDPDLVGESLTLDVEKFLRVRESRECHEFRELLHGLGTVSDEEIREGLDGLRARLGSMLGSRSGRVVRFLVTGGIGAIPVIGTGLGAAASLIDTFILEKLFPESGVVTFVNRLYPSIFKRG